jgi:hypothetical protein
VLPHRSPISPLDRQAQAYRNNEHSKYLLMAPGYDRSGGIGFPLRARRSIDRAGFE